MVPPNVTHHECSLLFCNSNKQSWKELEILIQVFNGQEQVLHWHRGIDSRFDNGSCSSSPCSTSSEQHSTDSTTPSRPSVIQIDAVDALKVIEQPLNSH